MRKPTPDRSDMSAKVLSIFQRASEGCFSSAVLLDRAERASSEAQGHAAARSAKDRKSLPSSSIRSKPHSTAAPSCCCRQRAADRIPRGHRGPRRSPHRREFHPQFANEDVDDLDIRLVQAAIKMAQETSLLRRQYFAPTFCAKPPRPKQQETRR